MEKGLTKKRGSQTAKPDDFKSVARRLGCDDDKGRFEQRLGKMLGKDKKRQIAKPKGV